MFSFSFLFPVSATVIGYVAASLDTKMLTTPLNYPNRIQQIIGAVLVCSIIIAIISSANIGKQSPFVVFIISLSDIIAQTGFDAVYIIHLQPLVTGWAQKLIWLSFIPVAIYVVLVDIIAIITAFSPQVGISQNNASNLYIYTNLMLGFTRILLHSITCFLLSVKFPSRGDNLPPRTYLPFLSGLFYLLACCVLVVAVKYGVGFVYFAFVIDVAIFQYYVNPYVQSLKNKIFMK
jgi:hypothetical protein